jgi:hypothetical protein
MVEDIMADEDIIGEGEESLLIQAVIILIIRI